MNACILRKLTLIGRKGYCILFCFFTLHRKRTSPLVEYSLRACSSPFHFIVLSPSNFFHSCMHHKNQERASPIVYHPLAHVFITPSCHRPVSLNSPSLMHAPQQPNTVGTCGVRFAYVGTCRVRFAYVGTRRARLAYVGTCRVRFAYVGTRRVRFAYVGT